MKQGIVTTTTLAGPSYQVWIDGKRLQGAIAATAIEAARDGRQRRRLTIVAERDEGGSLRRAQDLGERVAVEMVNQHTRARCAFAADVVELDERPGATRALLMGAPVTFS